MLLIKFIQTINKGKYKIYNFFFSCSSFSATALTIRIRSKVPRGVNSSYKNCLPLCVVPSSYNDFNRPPPPPPPPCSPLCSTECHKFSNPGKVSYRVSSYPQSHQLNLFLRLFACSQAKLTLRVCLNTVTTTF